MRRCGLWLSVLQQLVVVATVGYTMDTVYFGWIDDPVQIDVDVQFPQFKLIESLLYDCSMNYTAGTTYYYYDLLLRQLAAQIKKKTYIHKTTTGNDYKKQILNYTCNHTKDKHSAKPLDTADVTVTNMNTAYIVDSCHCTKVIVI